MAQHFATPLHAVLGRVSRLVIQLLTVLTLLTATETVARAQGGTICPDDTWHGSRTSRNCSQSAAVDRAIVRLICPSAAIAKRVQSSYSDSCRVPRRS